MSTHTASSILNLIATVDAASQIFDAETTWPDANTSEAFGQICEGLVLLLNEDLAGWDGGALYAAIAQIAERVRWSLDESEVIF